jgi:hypothetical protein
MDNGARFVIAFKRRRQAVISSSHFVESSARAMQASLVRYSHAGITRELIYGLVLSRMPFVWPGSNAGRRPAM